MNQSRSVLFSLLAITLVSQSAFAHPGHIEHSLAGGLSHPLLGVDHILAMLAIGLWAAQLGGRAVWAIPAAFVALMAAGGALGFSGVVLPGVEAGIAASVLALGLLLATAVKVPLSAGIPLAALFAIFHGHAHGTELSAGMSAAPYAAGFMLSTIALNLIGIGLGVTFKRLNAAQLLRYSGAAISVCGLLLALGVLKA
jgi:urease accessory protein